MNVLESKSISNVPLLTKAVESLHQCAIFAAVSLFIWDNGVWCAPGKYVLECENESVRNELWMENAGLKPMSPKSKMTPNRAIIFSQFQ
jgi:hypothetical protein